MADLSRVSRGETVRIAAVTLCSEYERVSAARSPYVTLVLAQVQYSVHQTIAWDIPMGTYVTNETLLHAEYTRCGDPVAGVAIP